MVIPRNISLYEKSDFEKLIFQQDGARPHTAKESIDCIERTFSNNVISQRTNFGSEWPAASPDLNVLDYAIWYHLEQAVSSQLPTDCSLSQLKTLVENACANFPIERVQRAYHDFIPRLELCKELHGDHFEKEIKWRKRHHLI